MIEKDTAGDRESCRAADAREQFDAELPLELLNLPAEGRLGDVEALRRAREVSLFRDRDERASESELQHRRIPRRSRTARLGVR